MKRLFQRLKDDNDLENELLKKMKEIKDVKSFIAICNSLLQGQKQHRGEEAQETMLEFLVSLEKKLRKAKKSVHGSITDPDGSVADTKTQYRDEKGIDLFPYQFQLVQMCSSLAKAGHS